MPSPQKFMKKELKPNTDIYVIKLTAGGKHLDDAKVGDVITFTRQGKDKSWGFYIDFPDNGPPDIPVAPNLANNAPASTASWTVLQGELGTWKYDISFPYDLTQLGADGINNQIVEPLDPIIIINPSLKYDVDLSFDYFPEITIFVLGFLAAFAFSYIRRKASSP